MSSTEDCAVATVMDRGLLTRRLKRLVLLTPPPLLAAVFPWNRGGDGEERNRDGWKWNAEVWQGADAPGVGAMGSRMEATRVAENSETARRRAPRVAVVEDAGERVSGSFSFRVVNVREKEGPPLLAWDWGQFQGQVYQVG
ncbi:hypothetical protein PIB30_016438 [Stylosanthes scabra]|uniref:Uncharacterized protein n=1 Tax=Stylosanthes scabra TaxID=79078 RepID=A0ABU6W948_9FABA|nr:hypothetical protein [Stylosanthes scabra]